MDEKRQDNLHEAIDNKFLPFYSIASGIGVEVLSDIYCYTNQIVNICCIGEKNADDWLLIDTGMPKSSQRLIEVLEERFGEENKPKAIILTHGHFDHVGAVVDLVKKWGVKVYAHEAELPFLTGKQSYPNPDGTVEGGLVAKMSPIFPNEPIDLGEHIEKLPSDGSVPHLPEWRWIHTPGHAPGQIALFRKKDRTLVAGDAFVTVKQESLYKVMTQDVEVNGPPKYLTTDWNSAFKSVKSLAALKPRFAVTGHGRPLSGQELTDGLTKLVREFRKVAVPDYGRYVEGNEDNEFLH